jgi:phosphoribosylanthranilate isomerase
MTIRSSDFATGSDLLLNDTGGNVGIGKTSPTEALDVSGNTVMSGTLNIGTVNAGTPVKNLAVDSSGTVVEASTSVSDQNKIFSWFMNVS